MSVGLLPLFQINVRTVRRELILFRISLPRFIRLSVGRPVSLFTRIIQRGFPGIFFVRGFLFGARIVLTSSLVRSLLSKQSLRNETHPAWFCTNAAGSVISICASGALPDPW